MAALVEARTACRQKPHCKDRVDFMMELRFAVDVAGDSAKA